MNIQKEMTPARQAAITSLAIVGFVALVAAGIWLAVYSTRFVPSVVNGLGSAAVYLGSVFNPSSDNGLSVVPPPAASSTISVGNGTSTATSTSTGSTPKPSTPRTPSSGTSGATRPVPPAPVLYGFPDLAVLITSNGYLATSGDLNSFTGSVTVPDGKQPAVQFSVENKGTNVSGPWTITTDPRLASSAETQPSLAPGARAVFIIYTDRTNKSTQPLTIKVSSNLAESTTNNNTISLTFRLD
jgi:hypothetical protein